MTSPTIREPNRLFVAADLPEPLRDALARAGGAVVAEHGGRRVPVENLHITLAFLGAVARSDAEALIRRLGTAAPGPGAAVRIGELTGRPAGGRARLAAVELEDVDGGLTALADRIGRATADLGLTDPSMPFWPHVTVARFSRPTRVRRSPPTESERVFDIDRVSLYDSNTTTSGPSRYEALMEVGLDGSFAERSSSHG